ncbi:hypothetical protein MMC18_009054 [Xylographa bjoerkii]|nr:hypothetical protein [Xylographa bjoerkii]
MASTTQRSNDGPRVLVHPKGPIVAEVVFVHGYGGDRFTSWTRDGICWPRDLLRKDVPNVRVITWGYDTSSDATIEDHANNLLLDLEDRSPETRSRPLIFVGISLGGLIVKQALISAVRKLTIERDPLAWNVWKATLGVMLIATLRRDETQNPPAVKLFENWGPESEAMKVHRDTWAYISESLSGYHSNEQRPGKPPLPDGPEFFERDKDAISGYDVEMGTADGVLGFGEFNDREDHRYQNLVQMMQHMLTVIVDDDDLYDRNAAAGSNI